LNTLETLRGMIADKFEVEPEHIQPEATLETLGLDSLAVFDLIFDINPFLRLRLLTMKLKSLRWLMLLR